MKNHLNRRWLYLVLGVVSMLFAGIIYGWSILKAPFAEIWNASQLALNFTITMTFFCLGGFVGAKLSKRFGIMLSIIAAGVLASAGFMLTAMLNGSNILHLYLSYGVLAGLGIGIAYNAVISTVNAWFPDKKGLCSGCLMMGFGASSLVIGNLASTIIGTLGWRSAYWMLGGALGAVLMIIALVLKKPDENVVFPAPKAKKPPAARLSRPRTTPPARCCAVAASGWLSWASACWQRWAAASSALPETWPFLWARKWRWPPHWWAF